MQVNGEAFPLPGAMRLLDLLQERKYDVRTIVIEYNGDIIKREDFDKVTLRDTDVVEILHFVGGGSGQR